MDRRLERLEQLLLAQVETKKKDRTPRKTLSTLQPKIDAGDNVSVKEGVSFTTDSGVDLQHLSGATPEKIRTEFIGCTVYNEELKNYLLVKSERSKYTRKKLSQDRFKTLLGEL